MRPGRQRGLTAAQQLFNLKRPGVPDGTGTLRRGHLTWVGDLTPSAFSRTYKVRIEYRVGAAPRVYVDEPNLVLLAGGRSLPHVYEQSPTRLCLYHPDYGEWHDGLLISQTMIPWTMLWLHFFEGWLASGEWEGGGEHPPPARERRWRWESKHRPGAASRSSGCPVETRP